MESILSQGEYLRLFGRWRGEERGFVRERRKEGNAIVCMSERAVREGKGFYWGFRCWLGGGEMV